MAMVSDISSDQNAEPGISSHENTTAYQNTDISNFEQINLLGTGAYGTVYRARDLRNPQCFVALKKIRMRLTDEGVPLSALREISVLRQIDKFDHPNIVRLLDVCVGQYCSTDKETSLTFVFECMDSDLAHFIKRCEPPGLPPYRVQNFMQQMLAGVDFLHSNKIIHRDLKPQNVLISRKGVLKLADMGLARIYAFSMLLTATVVTLWYRAPEVLMQNTYSSPVDLWSLGCIFAEMLNRKPLFPGQNEITQLSKIFEIMGLPEELDWPQNVSLPRTAFAYGPKRPLDEVLPQLDNSVAKDLLDRLLLFNQHERITAASALEHPYFRIVHKKPAGAAISSFPPSSSTPTKRKASDL